MDSTQAPEDSADAQDIALMLRVKQGDMQAFESLVENHQHRVVGTVARMLGNDSDAQDVAQQVFVRVWHSAVRYEPSAKFTTWLFTITRNLVFNEMRRRKRHPVSALEEEEETHHFQAADLSGRAPDATLLDDEMHEAIQRAIDSLPEQQRMAIVLRRYEEMPYEDMAVILKLTVPAVKSLLFRARTELRTKLAQYLNA